MIFGKAFVLLRSVEAPPSQAKRGFILLKSIMLPVLMLFLLPVGGGIPAGVLLASTHGLAWPITAGLYLVSDVILALAFEPILRLFVALGKRVSFLARLGIVMKTAMARNAAHFGGTASSPLMLILIAFGVDPMTGRATALAAGHGFILGWVFAITGDMLYYAVVAIATLRLNSYFNNPNTTMLIVLGAMIVIPMFVRFIRSRLGTVPA
ncbi:MAG: hypothetical protein P4L87_07735 [Formivibrio sp.]|nr:hypothetical protein [Formivibrio sp.]